MLDHRDDIESDFSAIHGIRRAEESLSAEEFFPMAERLMFYPGVLQMRAKMAGQEAPRDGRDSGGSEKPKPGRTAKQEVVSTRGVMESTPSMAGLIDWD